MVTAVNRLNSAMRGEALDRIPVFCNLLDQGPRELGLQPREYFSKGEYVAEAQLRMRKKYGYDNLWCLFYVGREAELFGCRNIIYHGYGPPNVGDMVIKSYNDVHRLVVPEDIRKHPCFMEQLVCIDILKKEAGGKYPICAYLTSSMTLPAMLMGMEKWMGLLLAGPEEIRDELLAKCSDFFIRQVDAYRKAGVDIFLYANPFASIDFLSHAMIEQLCIKWMQRDIKPGGAEGIVFYCGGARVNPTIELVLRKTGIKAYYLSPLDDVEEGLNTVAGRALCAGVFNDIKLVRLSPEEIRNEVKRIVEAGKPKKRFLFGTVVMPYDIPEKNIRTLVESACEYGIF